MLGRLRQGRQVPHLPPRSGLAVEQTGARSVIIGGGVSANRGLRSALAKFPVPVFFPPLRYCTDNAAMSAGLADVYFREARFSGLGLDAVTHSQFRDP
jgi:N6-L-threonylcarbamoyladenine synthase